MEVILRAASVETGDNNIDDTLRSTRYFSVVEHPLWRLSTDGLRSARPGRWNATGQLTLLAVGVPFELQTTARHQANVLQISGRATLARRRGAARRAVPILGRSGGRFDLFLRVQTSSGTNSTHPPTSTSTQQSELCGDGESP
jgi:hypothetical protein